MTENAAAIEVVGLTYARGSRAIVRDMSFEVAEGRCLALVGVNGAGKTTLLRCMAALVRPSAGEVRWFGRAARGDTAARRVIGVVAHDSLLYPHLTLRENLVFAARMSDVPHPAQRADALLDEARLSSCGDCLPRAVSQGMRQRVSIARALVHDPRILLLDEPFAGLDAPGAEWLAQRLTALRRQGTTLCFASHDQRVVELLADRVVELHLGKARELVTNEAAAPGDAPAAGRARRIAA